jgi:hypothetical protein
VLGTNTIRTPIELPGSIGEPAEQADEPEPPPLRLRGCRRLLEWHGKIYSKSAPARGRLEIWSVLGHDTKTYWKPSQYPCNICQDA